MLTKSHYAARKFVKRSFRRDYRQHMCGLCHALGDGYGLASRLLTNHDVILLNLLTSAQMPDDPQNVIRRCPMNPRHKVNTNQDDGSRFAAAVAVELANISVQDDLEDSNGGDLRARFAARMLKGLRFHSQSTFDSLQFDHASLDELNANQHIAETDSTCDPAQPTAEVSAALFVMTSRIANLPENQQALAQIGASYGAYLYLSDAFRDYADDVTSGAFNPLKKPTAHDQTHIKIPQNSLSMLHDRLHRILATIRIALSELTLFRYESALIDLLTEPIERLLAQVDAQRQRPVVYRQWRWQDALRAALFIMPEPAQGLVFSTGSDDEGTPTKQKRRSSSSSGTVDHDDTRSVSDGCTWCLIGCDGDRNANSQDACSGFGCGLCGPVCDRDHDGDIDALEGCLGGGCDAPDCLDGGDGCDLGDACNLCNGLDGCDGCDGIDCTP